ncbi:protein phosphatase methylesterase 1 [[Candida] anglica]|uniref:Protein phosphatase methylesterase 1 n=1 Tax=[Candida] anglica TaxID=148631 RepID=A0ABP0EBL5_9ASCO
MSDLHKLLLNRVRQHEQVLGLGSLAEEESSDSSIESTNQPPHLQPPIPVNSSYQRSIDNQPSTLTPPDDEEIFESYQSAKLGIFPVHAMYNSFQTYYKPPTSSKEPIFICHHGAGSSSMTFAVLTQALDSQWKRESGTSDGSPGVFAFDARGHGLSQSHETEDYTLSTLTDDFKFVLDRFIEIHKPSSSLYFIGHSLGGAVLTNYLNIHSHLTVKGLVMLDIVEETAVKALVAMPQFIKRRPTSFQNYQRAIDWHIKETGLLHNLASARISVPDLLIRPSKSSPLFWRTDLNVTQPFWETWFKGLSSNFITCGQVNKTAKLLILSGHENLDTDLIIGQMQGKYQLIAFNNTQNAGHFIHEDIPSQISISLVDFVRRNDSPEEYMKNELGFVPKWGGKINK